ncbi:tetratricopeptide repeat protein [Stieleria sp.]|uniref:tetratricopeptide repeat protein n=1 Tax=Stieleria sp. TaxID=2795976 RepID=UPI003562752E
MPAPAAAAPPTDTPTDSLTDSPTAADAGKLAAEALRTGDIDAAYQHARTAMSQTPEDPQVIFLMARVLGLRHRFPEAVRMLDRLMASHPETRLPALGQTSEWLVLHGDYAGAESRLRSLLDEVPHAAMAHRALANVLLGLGRRLEAADHLRTLCRQGDIQESELLSLLQVSTPIVGTRVIEPLNELAEALDLIAANRLQEARRVLRESSRHDADHNALLGRVLVLLHDAEGLEEWNPNKSLDRRDRQTWFAMGARHAWSGDHASATRCFCEVVLRDPTDGQAYELLSRSLSELGSEEPSNAAAERAELIARTQVIAAGLKPSANQRLAQIDELVQILEQLRRHDEALAWRSVQVLYGQSVLTKQQAIERMRQINQRRVELRQSGGFGPGDSFVVCGVELEGLRGTEVGTVEAE